MGVVLLRPAAAGSDTRIARPVARRVPPVSRGTGNARGDRPPPRPRPWPRRHAWAARQRQRTEVLLALCLALNAARRRAVAHPIAWWQLLASGRVEEVLTAAPRALSHGLVLGVVVTVVAVGGFERPQGIFTAPLGREQGLLSAQARLLLGPRAAEVHVRDALVRPALATTSQARPRADVTSYVVQPGDNIWAIGARFNVGMYSVLWSNGLDEDNLVMPGQELRIPPVAGTLHVVGSGDSLDSIAQKYNVDPAVIVDFNGLQPGEALTTDKLLIIPGGQLPIVRKPVAPPVPVVRPEAPAAVVAPPAARPAPAAVLRPSLRLPPQAPAPPPPPPPTGRLAWPTRGVITTSYAGWHPGIDIAAPLGTPIGAADGGSVVFAGWDSTGYGYRVVLNHGNGYSTTYSHLAVIGVRAGDAVAKGQPVGKMGSTGRSTGPHLHFEILRNGSFVNPLWMLN